MNGQTVPAAPILYVRNLSVPYAKLVLLAYTASYPRNGCQTLQNDLLGVENLAFLYLYRRSSSMLCD